MISKSVLVLAALVMVAWAGTASAQTTNCPTNFTCGFSSAETRAFSSTSPPPQQAGAPDVYIGYMTFNGTGGVSVATAQMINGGFSAITLTGTCTGGQNALPATINFAHGGPQWMFVTVNSQAGANGEELDFIQSQDVAGAQTSNANAVRVGVCRSPAP